MKKVRITSCTFQIGNFFTLKRCEVLGKRRNTKLDETKVTLKKMSNRAGGVAPALRHGEPCLFFFHEHRDFGDNTRHQGRNNMPIVKKAPGIMTREVKLEEPVNELLEDYARFIESNTDHVVNAVLKKVLWRDQDYRKWREARRATQSGSDKVQPATESRGRV